MMGFLPDRDQYDLLYRHGLEEIAGVHVDATVAPILSATLAGTRGGSTPRQDRCGDIVAQPEQGLGPVRRDVVPGQAGKIAYLKGLVIVMPLIGAREDDEARANGVTPDGSETAPSPAGALPCSATIEPLILNPNADALLVWLTACSAPSTSPKLWSKTPGSVASQSETDGSLRVLHCRIQARLCSIATRWEKRIEPWAAFA